MWDQYKAMRDDIKENGHFVVNTVGRGGGDRKCINPSVTQMNQLMDRIIRMAREFGMTPVSRSSLTVEQAVEEDDPLDLLNGDSK